MSGNAGEDRGQPPQDDTVNSEGVGGHLFFLLASTRSRKGFFAKTGNGEVVFVLPCLATCRGRFHR